MGGANFGVASFFTLLSFLWGWELGEFGMLAGGVDDFPLPLPNGRGDLGGRERWIGIVVPRQLIHPEEAMGRSGGRA